MCFDNSLIFNLTLLSAISQIVRTEFRTESFTGEHLIYDIKNDKMK